MKNEVMIVAAEASSSHFAQRLLEYWKAHDNQVHAFGVGSQNMEDLGFERFGKSEEMAVVGAAEIVEHWDKLKSVFNQAEFVFLPALGYLRKRKVLDLIQFISIVMWVQRIDFSEKLNSLI